VKKIGPGVCETVFVIGHCPAEGKKPLFTLISVQSDLEFCQKFPILL